jgi:hypothetical protein
MPSRRRWAYLQHPPYEVIGEIDELKYPTVLDGLVIDGELPLARDEVVGSVLSVLEVDCRSA